MAVIKCKMCGGDVDITDKMAVTVCKYCGSEITIPRLANDKKTRLYNKAETYRQNNEFDKAYDAYKIIAEEDNDPEVFWGMVLSEYGIEYVDDPKTHKRIPTCHRTHKRSVFDSNNYINALKYADPEQKMLYRDEAEVIDKLQKEIISISDKTQPYDVFISYKETDGFGERTQDSVLAQDIYEALEEKGLKTFFSRISLEDMIGTNYEPYIYSALSTAKVMLVVGMSNSNINSVWVRNEWTRFLKFRESSPEKVLIPVYKNMSPYELPPELEKYQGQDMSKIGAIQDLVHSVQRVIQRIGSNTDAAQASAVRGASEEDLSLLLNRTKAILDEKSNEIQREKELESKKKSNKKGIILIAIVAAILISVMIGMPSQDNTTNDDAINEVEADVNNAENIIESGNESVTDINTETVVDTEADVVTETYEEEPIEEVVDDTIYDIDDYGVHTYSLIVENTTWEEAYYKCLDMGGHLVRITSDEEWNAILQQISAEGKDKIKFWIGAKRDDDNDEYHWVYGENMDYGDEIINTNSKYSYYWLDGEPSYYDESTECYEDKVNIFYVKRANGWVWNDVPNDVAWIEFYDGAMGYICEFD
ncbi:MAG: TIR domain-containing protein [Butyrivibrio sp.]|nr:TIR domain-containing protein [Butyrivibrio sp.]